METARTGQVWAPGFTLEPYAASFFSALATARPAIAIQMLETKILTSANQPEMCYASKFGGPWKRELLWRSRSGGEVCISDRTCWGSTHVISKTRRLSCMLAQLILVGIFG